MAVEEHGMINAQIVDSACIKRDCDCLPDQMGCGDEDGKMGKDPLKGGGKVGNWLETAIGCLDPPPSRWGALRRETPPRRPTNTHTVAENPYTLSRSSINSFTKN